MSAGLALQAKGLATQARSALPGLATPALRLAVFGDSIGAQNVTGISGSGVWSKTVNGYAVWAEVLSRGGLRFDPSLNFGIGGQTSTQIAARTAAVIAAKPGYCAVLAGINDLGNSITPDTTKANLLAIYKALTAAGIRVIAIPLLPLAAQTNLTINAPTVRKLSDISSWIRAYASQTEGMILADPTLHLIDPADPLGKPLGGIGPGGGVSDPLAYTMDGLHPGPRGAYWIGKTILDALGSALRPSYPGSMVPSDVYDAANNLYGNKLLNSLYFSSTAGTLAGGATGVAPTSYTLTRQAGAVAGSWDTEALPNGQTIPVYRIDVTGSAGTPAQGKLSCYAAGGSFAAGEVLEGVVEADVSGIGADSLQMVQLQVYDGSGPISRVLGPQGGTGGATFFKYPNVPWGRVLRTPSFVATANAPLWELSFLLDGIANAAATIKIKRARLARVN